MILLVDHYDSFTWNLVQAFETLGGSVEVVRHDRIDPETAARKAPGRIVLSPGPKSPREAAGSAALIRRFAGEIPILGVCLGHQCIADAFGARVVRGRPFHGKTSPVTHDGRGVFAGLESPMAAMRYHSLVVDETTLPPELEATARTESGEVMGLRHRTQPIEGVQFHPESYRTPAGLELLRNFLRK
ncbi:MAG TPA: aminodeoxychorismate/anthranilate synthase component II [Planctomycetota bacterium]|nr:aminodeoxychorismate/anthranilate synthase component II [Planctomycetota bacterium]